MADIGHQLTEDILSDLEDRMRKEYERAVADAEKKLADYLKKFEKGKAEQKALLDAGKITEKDYQNWIYRHTMMGKQWEQMRDVLAEDLHRANEIALQMARGTMPDIYATNANYATYQIENGGQIDTGFTLYNHDTAEILMREDNIQLMPRPSTRKAAEIAANKDMQWNMRHIQSAVLQGVMQGESPWKVADRLRGVGQMDFNSSVRYARTMGTSAQNAGRYKAYERADALGVKLTIEWQATLDDRTRHDHRMMHGQRRDVGEPFITPDGYSILWPADSSSDYTDAPQSEIWNCRCTLLSWVKGFEGDTITSSPKMGEMSFEEWQQAKAPKPREENVAPEATQSGKPSVILGSKLRESLGSDADEYISVLENAQEGIAKTITDYSDQLTGCERVDGGGVYRTRTKSIEWDYADKSEGRNKYGTLSHELGHHVDASVPTDRFTNDEIGRINEIPLSISPNRPPIITPSASNSDEFLAAMRADRGLNMDYITDKTARAAIKDDLLGNGNRNITVGIQDAFDGFWGTRSNLDIYLPWGHGDKYYNADYNLAKALGYEKGLKDAYAEMGFDASSQAKVKTIMRDYQTASELWANIQSAMTTGGKELEMMEKYFPSACQTFRDLILR